MHAARRQVGLRGDCLIAGLKSRVTRFVEETVMRLPGLLCRRVSHEESIQLRSSQPVVPAGPALSGVGFIWFTWNVRRALQRAVDSAASKALPVTLIIQIE